MASREQALTAIQIAIKHLGQGKMVDSARLSLFDATICLSQGEWQYAKERAMTSIQYSVGYLHQDYQGILGNYTF